ncbi:MAG: hypothetical protein DMG05_07545 [Acidobacteria bacterium]|nr:MAG: hypothetical protein DMG05_07545 [Acidobacteriota bacterium]
MFFLATKSDGLYTYRCKHKVWSRGFDQHLSGHWWQEEGGPWPNQSHLKRAIRIGILQVIYNFFETFELVLTS